MKNHLVSQNETVVIEDKTFEQLTQVSSATATLILLKQGIRACFITGAKPLNAGRCAFVAEAFTLRFIPMREDLSTPEVLADGNYAPRKLIEEIPQGSALVVDARGDVSAGVIGGILAARLHERGCKAVVTDGAVRDVAELKSGHMPIFSAGAAASATIGSHYGSDYQNPIGCGGVAIVPGDILIGDEDGVVVVPRGMAKSLAEVAVEQERLERFIGALIARGRPTVGVYPPNDETRGEYEAWVAAGEPPLD